MSNGAGGELPQRGGALLLHVGVRRKIFKRKHVVGGKAHDARGIDGAGQLASGLEQRLQRLGGLVVGNDDDDRLLGGPRHERHVEGPRGGGQSGHTPPPRTQAEVPANALKSRRTAPAPQKFRGQTGGSCTLSLTAMGLRVRGSALRGTSRPARGASRKGGRAGGRAQSRKEATAGKGTTAGLSTRSPKATRSKDDRFLLITTGYCPAGVGFGGAPWARMRLSEQVAMDHRPAENV